MRVLLLNACLRPPVWHGLRRTFALHFAMAEPSPNLLQKLLRYIELRIEFELLRSRSRVAPVASQVLIRVALVVMLSLATVFVSLAAAVWMDRALGGHGLGFAAVALVYAALAVGLWSARAWVAAQLRRQIDRLLDASLAHPALPESTPHDPHA
jgi:hypothetical protein